VVAAAETRALTDEQKAVIRDLHWLADEGYIIEYSDGTVFIGVQAEQAPKKAKAAGGDAKADAGEAVPVVDTAGSTTEVANEESSSEEVALTPEESVEVATDPSSSD
jgi:hypothetical protein